MSVLYEAYDNLAAFQASAPTEPSTLVYLRGRLNPGDGGEALYELQSSAIPPVSGNLYPTGFANAN